MNSTALLAAIAKYRVWFLPLVGLAIAADLIRRDRREPVPAKFGSDPDAAAEYRRGRARDTRAAGLILVAFLFVVAVVVTLLPNVMGSMRPLDWMLFLGSAAFLAMLSVAAVLLRRRGTNSDMRRELILPAGCFLTYLPTVARFDSTTIGMAIGVCGLILVAISLVLSVIRALRSRATRAQT